MHPDILHYKWVSMIQRSVFLPSDDENHLVKELRVSFTWNTGYGTAQMRKNAMALHEAAAEQGIGHLLEISTKSDEQLGVCLSAFNLKLKLPEIGEVPLEAAYQGSKVFKHGGPFTDLYRATPYGAKRDNRLRQSGGLAGFRFLQENWPLEPKTAFYDWLYIQALIPHQNWLTKLASYRGFTDIAFNPQRAVNCQARSCAAAVTLMQRGLLKRAVSDRREFIKMLGGDASVQPRSSKSLQLELS